jgi:cyclophilin family peptidyl-prolyl cis-trans isomerase
VIPLTDFRLNCKTLMTRQTIKTRLIMLAGVSALIAGLVACNSSASSNKPASAPAQSPCEHAMKKAGSSPSVVDLYPGMRACSSLAELGDALRKYPNPVSTIFTMVSVCAPNPIPDAVGPKTPADILYGGICEQIKTECVSSLNEYGTLALAYDPALAACQHKYEGTQSSSQSTSPAPPPTTPPATAVPSVPQSAGPAPANIGCPKPDGSSPDYTKFQNPPPTCIDPTKKYAATIQTDVGTITVSLDPVAAPKTVNNFVFLAGYHYFDGIVFHRVVPNFVIQGGDPTGTGTGGPGYVFPDELPNSGAYKIGSLVMANSGPNTNGSQFFIITGQQGVSLPPNYSLFGQVTSGTDVIAKVNADGAADPNPPSVIHRMVQVTITES